MTLKKLLIFNFLKFFKKSLFINLRFFSLFFLLSTFSVSADSIFLKKAEKALEKGDYLKAIELTTDSIKNIFNTEAYFLRAIAKRYQSKKIIKNNNNKTTRISVDLLYDAISDYQEYINSNPNSYNAYLNMGNIKHDLGDLDGAHADYSKAIELNPKFALAYRNRGNLGYHIGSLSSPCKDFFRAAELGDYYAKLHISENHCKPACLIGSVGFYNDKKEFITCPDWEKRIKLREIWNDN